MGITECFRLFKNCAQQVYTCVFLACLLDFLVCALFGLEFEKSDYNKGVFRTNGFRTNSLIL